MVPGGWVRGFMVQWLGSGGSWSKGLGQVIHGMTSSGGGT